MEPLNEVTVIWGAELWRSIRSAKAIILLALYLMFTAMAVAIQVFIFRSIQTNINEQLALHGGSMDALQPQIEEVRHGFLGWLLGGDETLIESIAQVPLIVLVTFKITLYFLPIYIAIIGFDQISGEIGPRSIRYLTVRARRSSILWGKYLSQATLLAGLVLVVDVALVLVARWMTPSFQLGVMAGTFLKCWVAATVFSLSYVALSTLCSSLFRSPAVSLVFNILTLFGLWLVNKIGESAAGFMVQEAALAQARGEEAPAPSRVATVLSWLQYVSPSHYSDNLLHPHFLKFLGSTAIYAGFAAAFLACGYAVLRRRDL
ncbi:MAG TPA: ABC transporter permease subunit [Myxococcaceae bacterium]|nr:ABC transporter permease subunit [Myxococcaceae bacterium]